MKFHDSLIVLDEQMLDDELSPVAQNLVELRESPGQKIKFRPIVTGERMCATPPRRRINYIKIITPQLRARCSASAMRTRSASVLAPILRMAEPR